jgi:hypothetical protein
MTRRLALLVLFTWTIALAQKDVQLRGAYREEKDGWIFLHLEGQPRAIGFQHGYLLAEEIADAIKMITFSMQHTTSKDWDFYRAAAERVLWPKLEHEYQEEIRGISDGLYRRGKNYDLLDITALNGFIELRSYYVPALASRAKKDSLNNRAPGNCSAFIATGSFTRDGEIVMAHNNWSDYIEGERWNIVLDIVPARGHRMMMDAFPGFIHSGDDFALNDAGILVTETTISSFKGFKEDATPEFMRARKAAQYAESIDDFVRIMETDNNGGYANTWLVGDLKTNEIAKLDLGLRYQHLWRTHDGCYVGSNFGTDDSLLACETTFDTKDSTNSCNARRKSWERILTAWKGRIDVESAKRFMGDHYDVVAGRDVPDKHALCGHIDIDSTGIREWSTAPYFPTGAVSGKATDASLARGLQFWARTGHPCGEGFRAGPFLEKHPEYAWQAEFLKDMPGHPWSLFGPARR